MNLRTLLSLIFVIITATGKADIYSVQPTNIDEPCATITDAADLSGIAEIARKCGASNFVFDCENGFWNLQKDNHTIRRVIPIPRLIFLADKWRPVTRDGNFNLFVRKNPETAKRLLAMITSSRPIVTASN